MIDDVFLFLFTNVFSFILELSDENGFIIARDSKTPFLFGHWHITSVETLIHLTSVDIKVEYCFGLFILRFLIFNSLRDGKLDFVDFGQLNTVTMSSIFLLYHLYILIYDLFENKSYYCSLIVMIQLIICHYY